MAISGSFLLQKRFLIVVGIYVAGILFIRLNGFGDFRHADVNTTGRTLPVYRPPTMPGFGKIQWTCSRPLASAHFFLMVEFLGCTGIGLWSSPNRNGISGRAGVYIH
uniref:Uncharacterized protein n=1 Tax=Rhodosorus marinus TaxID=101924 RepID=A0A7S2ZHT3_9RHOD